MCESDRFKKSYKIAVKQIEYTLPGNNNWRKFDLHRTIITSKLSFRFVCVVMMMLYSESFETIYINPGPDSGSALLIYIYISYFFSLLFILAGMLL